MAERRLRRAIALLSATLGAGGAAAVAAGLAIAAVRIDADGAVPHLVLAGMIAGGAVLGLAAWAFFRLDERLVRPLDATAHRLELAASGEQPGEGGLPDQGLAAPVAIAADAAIAALEAARHDRDAATANATARIDEQRRRLEAVIRDLQEGVVVCAADNRVLLYNRCAVGLLDGAGELGLGRPIDRLLTPEPLRHALERLARGRAHGERHPTTTAVCGSLHGQRTLQCRVSLLPVSGETPAGYILSFRDVTGELAGHAERDRLLKESLESVRRIGSGLCTTLDMLLGDPEMPDETRRMFERSAAEDGARLAATLATFAERADRSVAGHWPLADISSDDIVDSAIPRIAADTGLSVRQEGEALLLRSDGSSLVQLVCALAAGVARASGTSELVIRAVGGEGAERAYLDLCWPGEVLVIPDLDRLIEVPLPGGIGFTGREVLDRHGGEAWCDRAQDGRARLRLALRRAGEMAETAPVGERPEFYDFDLAAHPEILADERPLDGLTYVVFDTETTGLDPSGGDRIVQIAGVRIVNGRVLGGEVFDSLVQPGRPIPAASTQVHGITDAMVADAPPLGPVLARFHAFAADAVLVAHNAAFDMAFLRRDEGQAGVAFDQPVLDTVLLSAFLQPDSRDHTLDGLCQRYGVPLDPDVRHTAIGDATATARVFLAMLPLLARRDVRTLGHAIGVSDEAAGIRRRQKRY